MRLRKKRIIEKDNWDYSLKQLKKSELDKVVRFCDVDTTEFVEVTDIYNIPDVKDKIVKVCPRITSSEKLNFDKVGIVQNLYSQGAKSVVLAPIIAPDKKKVDKKVSGDVSSREVVKFWFNEQQLSNKEKEHCIELLYSFMDQENM